MITRSILVLALGVAIGGCSIRHEVSADYPQYLANNRGAAEFPRIGQAAVYFLDPETTNHHLEFRAVTAGYGNLWIVEFGKMLDDTLQEPEIQSQFTSFGRVYDLAATSDLLIIFRLDEYRFEDFGAHVTLAIKATRGAQTLVARDYQADGRTQGGKVFWGGVFAMKNAIQQSTKNALDTILRQFLTDLQAAVST